MHPSALPPGLAARPFSVATALARGVGPGRLRRRDLIAPHRGVRVDAEHAAAAAGRLGRILVLAPVLRGHQWFSHVSAAVLLDLRVPLRFLSMPVHISSAFPDREPRREGVVGHRVRRPPRTLAVGDGRCTHPVDAWIELAPLCSVDELIVMADGLVQRRSPVATIDELADRVDAARGLPGRVKLVAALAEVRAGTDSGRETETRLVIVRAGLPEPVVNLRVLDPAGRHVARLDLGWEEYRTGLEYDGDHHRTDEDQFEVDIDRLGRLAALDWRVMRVGKRLFPQPRMWLRRLETLLEHGGWRRS